MTAEYLELSLLLADDRELWNLTLDVGFKHINMGLAIGVVACLSFMKDVYAFDLREMTRNVEVYIILTYYEYTARGIYSDRILRRKRIDELSDLPVQIGWPGVIMLSNISVSDITHTLTVRNTNFMHSFWIRNKLNLEENSNTANLYEFENKDDIEEVLQGVLTMCNAFNLDPDAVILACPLHDGYPYYIEGINLPILPAFPQSGPIYPIDDEGTTFESLPYNQIGDIILGQDFHRDDWDNY